MDKELKELLLKLGVSMDSIATGINAIKDCQTAILDGVKTLKGGEKGKADDAEEEDDEEDDKKKSAVAKLTKTVADLTKKLDTLSSEVAEHRETIKTIDTNIELIVKKLHPETKAAS